MAEDNASPRLIEMLSVEGFQAEYPGLVHSIFGPYYQDGFCTEPIENGIFTNPGWRCFLVPHVINAVDRTGDIRYGHDWKATTSSAYSEQVNWMQAIMLVHWSRPVEHVLYTMPGYLTGQNWYWEPPGPVYRLKALAEEIQRTPLHVTPAYRSMMLFDEAGEWGMIDCEDEQISVIGAKGGLYDHFIAVFGGLDRIKARMNQRFIEEYRRYFTQGDSAAMEAFQSHFRMIYGQVGWEWPYAPNFDPAGHLFCNRICAVFRLEGRLVTAHPP